MLLLLLSTHSERARVLSLERMDLACKPQFHAVLLDTYIQHLHQVAGHTGHL